MPCHKFLWHAGMQFHTIGSSSHVLVRLKGGNVCKRVELHSSSHPAVHVVEPGCIEAKTEYRSVIDCLLVPDDHMIGFDYHRL